MGDADNKRDSMDIVAGASRVSKRAFSILAPAGGFPSFAQLARAARRASEEPIEAVLERTIAAKLSAASVQLCASGTAALWTVFTSLRESTERRTIAACGYNCPDIAAAAVAAGFRLALADCDPGTLEPDLETLPQDAVRDLAAVVFTNLYGLLDDIDRWAGRLPDNVLLVDDGCQSSLGSVGGIRSGLRGGVGVLSFGRGKAICGVGGGAVISRRSPDHAHAPNVAAGGSLVRRIVQASIYSALEHPLLYGIPARIPGLGLGQTVYHEDFDKNPIDRGRAAVALAALENEEWARAESLRRMARFGELLPAHVVQPSRQRPSAQGQVLTRYPILAPDPKIREEWYRLLSAAGLGASRSYPCTLDTYPQLQGKVVAGELIHARQVAERILTLPLHRYVRGADQEHAAEVITRIG